MLFLALAELDTIIDVAIAMKDMEASDLRAIVCERLYTYRGEKEPAPGLASDEVADAAPGRPGFLESAKANTAPPRLAKTLHAPAMRWRSRASAPATCDHLHGGADWSAPREK